MNRDIELSLTPRLRAMLGAWRTGQKDARTGAQIDAGQYSAREGSAWAAWYQAGADGLPVPPEVAARGIHK